jgi:hypothetical protein
MISKRLFAFSLMVLISIPLLALTLLPDPQTSDTIRFDDGSWYCGEVADSLFNGRGKMVYADSTVYEGEWKDGLWDGKGKIIYPDGDSYEGDFSEHNFNGNGTYIYSDGRRYDGEWENGAFSGIGTFDYGNGDTFTGQWKNDLREGFGLYYDASSQTYRQEFYHEDRRIFTLEDNASGNTASDNTAAGNTASRNEKKEPEFKYNINQDNIKVGLSYGMGQFLAFQADFNFNPYLFAGFSVGINTNSYGVGKQSFIYNDDTGEKIILVEWDSYPDEILTEHTYPGFNLLGEFGTSLGNISFGGSAGLSLMKTYRFCRSRAENESYFSEGTLYYRKRITGVEFSYRLYTDIQLKNFENFLFMNHNGVFLRLGYGNHEKVFVGFGINI